MISLSFDGYANKINNDIAYMKSNVSKVNDNVNNQNLKTEDLKMKMDTLDYSTTTLKADVTELTTKIYNIKTSGFEHSNELSGVKSKIKGKVIFILAPSTILTNTRKFEINKSHLQHPLRNPMLKVAVFLSINHKGTKRTNN